MITTKGLCELYSAVYGPGNGGAAFCEILSYLEARIGNGTTVQGQETNFVLGRPELLHVTLATRLPKWEEASEGRE